MKMFKRQKRSSEDSMIMLQEPRMATLDFGKRFSKNLEKTNILLELIHWMSQLILMKIYGHQWVVILMQISIFSSCSHFTQRFSKLTKIQSCFSNQPFFLTICHSVYLAGNSFRGTEIRPGLSHQVVRLDQSSTWWTTIHTAANTTLTFARKMVILSLTRLESTWKTAENGMRVASIKSKRLLTTLAFPCSWVNLVHAQTLTHVQMRSPRWSICVSKDLLDGPTGSTKTSMTSLLKLEETQMRVTSTMMDQCRSRKWKLSPDLIFSMLREKLSTTP